MDDRQQRAALAALIDRDGVSLATLSRALGRNDAWMQQYLRRGTPRVLAERDRGKLARFFGVDERVLGGAARDGIVAVRRYDLTASAGGGSVIGQERAAPPVGYPAEELARLGVAPDAASVIEVEGDSMLPTLRHGDRILVDHGQRLPAAASAIWVLRVDDELRVKRLAADGQSWRIASDNPDWADELRPMADVEVIGRVVHLTRHL